MTKRPDDAEFSQKLRLGDVEAFRQFFRQRSPEVLALCRNILRNTQDAEDVMADVFFEVWSQRNRFDPDKGSLRSYTLMLARSRAIDLYRKKANLQARVNQPIAAEDLAEVDVQPHHNLAMNEFRRFAESALDDISPEEKIVIELSVFQGMSHSQIANHVDTPLGTVKSHIRRGLAKLRQRLKQWEA